MKPSTTGYAPVNGLNMYYEIYGEGDVPLVLIHGGGSTIETSFGNLIPLLAGHFKLIAVELQAHGRTSDRDVPESFETDAADVAALLKHLGVEKANFLGFSNGGTTTLLIAKNYPQVVNSIIVVSANYRRDGMLPDFFGGLATATLNDMPQMLQEGYLKVNPSQEGLQRMFKKDRQRMLDFTDIPDADIQAIKAPALIMVGDKDVMTVDHVLSMSKLIEGSQMVVLPGWHGTMIGEVMSVKPGSKQVEITATLITEFLQE